MLREHRPDGARVEFQGARRLFKETGIVVDGFDLTIQPGEFVSLLGPSGCGKSTLLRMAAGLDAPDAGSVSVSAGASAAFRSFVFQEAHLLPWRNVLGNAMLPLRLLRRPREESRRKSREALHKVGLGDALAKYPAQLSGGMKMRVSVARALVTEPRLLLLDEPFAALDENTRFKLQEDLRALWLAEKMTVIFVTHSVSEAVFLSDRAVVLSPRPARILLNRNVQLPPERSRGLRTDSTYFREIEAITAAFRDVEGLP